VGEPCVIFDGVWKKFRRGERHDSLRDLIPATAKKLFGRKRDDELEEQEFWALKDVSFEVKPGEALGIIGPNGAGKSTTLKLLTRILKPTRGHCELRGRVGALIEVAAGFHPDLTGRENIYLQAAIMGMKRGELATKIDQIIEFAGVGPFIDTPVKRYSSGMNARLGFSIAAHLGPDVLIIDEVLSVGDMPFQHKCVERMLRYKAEGKGIVFVTHNLAALVALCDSAILLSGSLQARGSPPQVVRAYAESLPVSALPGSKASLGGGLHSIDGEQLNSVDAGSRVRLFVDVQALEALPGDLVFGFLVERLEDASQAYDGNFSAAEIGWRNLTAGARARLLVEFSANLTRGNYKIGCHLYDAARDEFVARVDSLATLAVVEAHSWAGLAFLDPCVRCTTDL
jgi:lipopolysaccharide transport system ATP-binding protein